MLQSFRNIINADAADRYHITYFAEINEMVSKSIKKRNEFSRADRIMPFEIYKTRNQIILKNLIQII